MSFLLLQAGQVGVEDVSRAYTLFLDVQRSTQFMVDHADQVTFDPRNEVEYPQVGARSLSGMAALQLAGGPVKPDST